MDNPLVKGANVSLEGEIPCSRIISLYKRKFKMDVGKYFSDSDTVRVYRCQQTGYRFYYPFSLAGDSSFYEHLQEYEWYYNPWKWEHQICSDLILPGQNILEVGCGRGDFLLNLRKKREVFCTGLELNKSVSSPGKGVEIFHQTIEEFSALHKEKFDLVCSFQVLEHISQVNSFLKAKIDCLKKGGLLLISVPNNDSFIRLDKHDVLNKPPHHMGLWNEKSLRKLENIFEIKCREIRFEPLQPYHYQWYVSLMASKYIGYYPGLVWGKLVFMLFNKPITQSLNGKAGAIPGHTITAIYQKK